MGVLRVAFLSALVLEWIEMISTAVVAVEIGLRLLYGCLTLERAFFVLLLAPEFYLPLRQLGMRFHAGMAGAENMKRILSILEMRPEQPEAISSPGAVFTPCRKSPRIEFDGVAFGFDEERPLLQDINFVIEAGEILALLAPTGAERALLEIFSWALFTPNVGRSGSTDCHSK